MGLDEYGTAHQVAIQIHDAVRYVLDVLWGEVVFEHPGIGVSSRLYGSYIIGNAEDGRVEDAVGILKNGITADALVEKSGGALSPDMAGALAQQLNAAADQINKFIFWRSKGLKNTCHS